MLSIKPEFCWNVDGLVDIAKTASLVTRDRSLNVTFRYRVACAFCLQDSMDNLWQEMSHDERAYQMSTLDFRGDTCSSMLANFWTCLKRCKMNRLAERVSRNTRFNTVDYFGFHLAVEVDNELAKAYFWPRLSISQQESYFELLAYKDERISATTRTFLLTKLNRDKQMQLFKTHGCIILNSLVDCGRIDILSKAVPLCLPYLTAREYDDILENMTLRGTYTFEILSLEQLQREW